MSAFTIIFQSFQLACFAFRKSPNLCKMGHRSASRSFQVPAERSIFHIHNNKTIILLFKTECSCSEQTAGKTTIDTLTLWRQHNIQHYQMFQTQIIIICDLKWNICGFLTACWTEHEMLPSHFGAAHCFIAWHIERLIKKTTFRMRYNENYKCCKLS